MTTPGKNQSTRTPNRDQGGSGKEMGEDELEGVRNPTTGEDELSDDEGEGEASDRVPEESVNDRETGRIDRDSDRPEPRDRSRGA